MINEEHFQIGNKEFFNKYLEVNGAIFQQSNSIDYYGIKVIENKFVPKDRALFVDRYGKILKVFKLKTWKTKRENK